MKSTKALPLLMQKVPSLRLFLDCILDFLMEAIVEGRLLFDGETRAREGGMVIFRCSFITIGSCLSLFGQKYCWNIAFPREHRKSKFKRKRAGWNSWFLNFLKSIKKKWPHKLEKRSNTVKYRDMELGAFPHTRHFIRLALAFTTAYSGVGRSLGGSDSNRRQNNTLGHILLKSGGKRSTLPLPAYTVAPRRISKSYCPLVTTPSPLAWESS